MRSKKIVFAHFQGDCEFNYCVFGPTWTHPHVRNTLIAFLIIANQGEKFAFAFIILAFKCGPTVCRRFTAKP